MKRTNLLVCIALLISAWAQAASGPNGKISVQYDKTPLKAVLKDFEEKSGLRFAYADKLVADAGTVSLTLTDTPAHVVLNKLLRPCGLEAIMSKKGLAAIVPQASDMGMAKAAGRAIRIFVRLAKKLETAELQGDEVKVATWTDQDDEDLALGITDMISVCAFYELNYRVRGGIAAQARLEAVERMVRSHDRDVRAGAILPFAFATLMGGGTDNDVRTRIETLVRRCMADESPLVQGCWLLLAPYMYRRSGRQWAADAMKQAAASLAPEVRFAVCVAALDMPQITNPLIDSLPDLIKDASPSVRLGALVAILERFDRVPALAQRFKRQDLQQALVKDANPIVRSLGLTTFLIGKMSRRAPDALQALLVQVEKQNDPWLGLFLKLLGPAFQGEEMLPVPALVQMATSKKRSHQAMALGATLLGLTMARLARRGQTPKPPKLSTEDLTALVKLAESDWLWSRAGGVLASAFVPMAGMLTGKPVPPKLWKKAETHYLDGLQSADEPVRLTSLLASMARLQLGPLPPLVMAAARRTVDRGPAAEQMLGGYLLGVSLPVEEALAALKQASARDADSLASLALLQGIEGNKEVRGGENKAAAADVLQTVLAAKSSPLEIRLVHSYRYRANRSEVFLALLDQGQVDTVLAMMTDFCVAHAMRSDPLSSQLVKRLTRIWDTAEPSEQGKIVRALARSMAIGGSLEHAIQYANTPAQETVRKQIGALAAKMVEACFKQDSPHFAAGLALLTSWVNLSDGLKDGVPIPIQEQAIHVLELISHKTHDPGGARLLARLLHAQRSAQRRKKDLQPALVQAMAKAQATVLEKGAAESRTIVLCALACLGDQPAVQELTSLLVQGKMPAANIAEALGAVASQPRLVQPVFAEHAVRLMETPSMPLEIRVAASNALASIPAQREVWIEACNKLLTKRPADPLLHRVVLMLRMQLQNHNRMAPREVKEQPAPAWKRKASALGLKIFQDRSRPAYERGIGLDVFLSGAGADAAKTMEDLVRKEGADAHARQKACELLHKANPKTALYGELLPKYGQLPVTVRGALAASAAQSPDADKAEAFVIRALGDSELRKYRSGGLLRNVCSSLRLPQSDALTVALNDLKKDKQAGMFVDSVLRRWEREPGRTSHRSATTSKPAPTPEPVEVF